MTPPIISSYSTSKPQFYSELTAQVTALIDPSLPLTSNLSNMASLLFWAYHDPAIDRPVNWVGFYLHSSLKPGFLLLGPFHGRIACTMIKMGKGVCGTSASERRPMLIANVHEFAGHIACDSLSMSELVIPLVHADGRLLGVLDLDSTVISGFDEADLAGLLAVVDAMVSTILTWTFE
ncbi:hypothetical protein BASA50_008001 [Batrachochytrium salamandrivorans]|uniref:GAF domain-containing protein n=1 Tax=Batrachochytrium salamandrivorans TaxID=1357716 RepID=A0ABQ8F5E3_9FUNG|nr:hypothetical protein BASA62_005161 [Batrachochytrium salamandrivorans]KAH6572580.1 hypothetical protein BASA60_006549 [Batrachochytrium salamandrivorans]KAH6585245.1 hypothetical protein BASA61_006973 [Batrachochytrium salamandrivorans]KAH6592551.1 hypothetical protein BASA50_008001 [Batrachochytrium salamandrivorans]KAH9273389.1 hypothetical protein BASA83_004392 [Batrachochytrium salamandrivorans]